MHEINTAEYISILRSAVNEGHEVSLPVSGNSMSPFVRDERDRVYFKAPDRALRVGDIVFFQRKSGQYVLHRVCKVKDDKYFIIGDAQNEVEGPISSEQIFAVVTKVERNGKLIHPGNITWEFFSKIWARTIRLRPAIRRIYGTLK